GGPPLAARVVRVDPSAVTRVSALGIEEQRVTAVLAPQGEPAAWQGLGDGYRVTAHIMVWQGQALTAVPVGSLFRSGNDWAVFRIEGERARLTPLEIGERNPDWAEVRRGLDPGAEVILHPGDHIVDGVRVRAAEMPDT
ncbi:MAG TPA: RND transporter, partial [Paracoccus sp. (in: a-proteobacteria)]|nr:RND transporter [Paracoccus sp. (in: a-proteobacteria)]